MTVCYLEIDDEITGAIARLRAVKDGEAVIVVPPGSRIATSRINFKLLVREATERRLNVTAVSDDPAVRALAISAGLPAYDSLAGAEQALATFREQDRKLAERLGRAPGEGPRKPAGAAAVRPSESARPGSKSSAPIGKQSGSDVSERTEVLPASFAATAAAAAARDKSSADAADLTLPSVARDRQRPRIGIAPLVGAAVLLLLLIGVGYGAYLFLPTATITLAPLTTEVRPQPLTVVADPNVAVPDVAAAVVPAQWLEIPLAVTDTFTATGIEAHETRATGTVRFRSENTADTVAVPQDTVVATADGVEFQTTEAATIPRADFGSSTPGIADVPVRAVRAGLRGNVQADAIRVVPQALRSQLVSARNPDPTQGGEIIEEAVVTQEDFDAALISLDVDLETALSAAMADPITTPRGLKIFPITAQTGRPEPAPSAEDVVGLVQPSFTVTFESVGTVLAVNESLVDELAEARLRSGLAPGSLLVGDAVETTRSAGVVVAPHQTVAYEVAAVATAYAEPDPQGLIAQVRGKPVVDAERILSPYGTVDISMWPEFVDRLPDQTARISLILVAPSPRP